jgi:starch synthase (maltosyl-transferring)
MRQPWAAWTRDIAPAKPSRTASAPLEQSPLDPTGPRFRIEDIYPSLEGGLFPVKRTVGETIDVWADILREGHEVIAAELLWRRESRTGEPEWQRAPLTFHSNDRWHGNFTPPEPGLYVIAIEAWTDTFATWRRDTLLKKEAGQVVTLEMQEGAALLKEIDAAGAVPSNDMLSRVRGEIAAGRNDVLLDTSMADAISARMPRPDATRSAAVPITVDPAFAACSAWYEIMPRSQSAVPGRHGKFRDCIARLPDIEAMGFDVLYMPPIHPIGRTNRKGRNNALTAGANDPGSPYAIGSEAGGHTAVHPELGTLEDFRALVAACRERGIQVALDFAIQCSPDHPWLKEHPEWFKRRPDGTIKYAENPPKKYEDIVNPDFYCTDRIALWQALRDIVLFWTEQGVRIFRVDNPHTKPLPFWEWMIREVRLRVPDTVFLAEAFTRPKMMKALAKIGFSQSYSYFTWRTQKGEIEEYLSELTRYPEREYFRANFFVTTPDILPVQLQSGEMWMFKSRFALAALLSSNYGIYNGYELLEHEPVPGKEEYLNSEKYEIKTRDWNAPGNIKPYITKINAIRRDNSALLQTSRLHFLPVNDGAVTGFLKENHDGSNAVAAAIALSPGIHEFWFHFGDLMIGPDEERRPVRALENLQTGVRQYLEWGGLHLRIDTSADPTLLFRCIA